MSDFSAQAPDHQPPWTRRRQTTGSDSSPTGEPWPLRFYRPGLSPKACITARKQAKLRRTAPFRYQRPFSHAVDDTPPPSHRPRIPKPSGRASTGKPTADTRTSALDTQTLRQSNPGFSSPPTTRHRPARPTGEFSVPGRPVPQSCTPSGNGNIRNQRSDKR